MATDTLTALYSVVEAVSQLYGCGLSQYGRGRRERKRLRAELAIFPLLRPAIPVEPDTVVTCFTLPLTVDTMRFLFSAVSCQKASTTGVVVGPTI
jgi:hypothetical protein